MKKGEMPERLKDLNLDCAAVIGSFDGEEFAFLFNEEADEAPGVDGGMPTTRDVSDVPVSYDDPCYNDCMPL